jgi:MinD-like ATPase involved in chromosome partitioning or flagellar assembly
MKSIVTFYSYKGGVGRSMALANVAVLLARRGLRVLAVDWDLEAPGLERYFSYFPVEARGAGLLRMFMDAEREGEADYSRYLWEVDCDAEHPLSFLPSGRDSDADYSTNLEGFDWAGFFREQGGGQFVEGLRARWREDFDIVLIDSRTGLSDTGGICTIQLPDVVVAMFTANHQSLYGIRDVMRLAQRARQSLAYDRMPLTILPLPARFGTRAEFSEAQDWLGQFEEVLQEFFDDWLPRTMKAKQVLERVKVPQVDFFAFGEKLAVVEQGTNDPEGMGYVYDKVAALLTSDFSDIEAVVGTAAVREQKAEEKSLPEVGTSPKRTTDEYRYDIFVSVEHYTLAKEFAQTIVKSLRAELELYLPEPRIFMDITEIGPGVAWAEQLSDALTRSKLLIPIVTPMYFRRGHTLAEFLTFDRRSEITGADLLLPIVIRGSFDVFPDNFKKYVSYNFERIAIKGRRYANTKEFQLQIRGLATRAVDLLEKAPPFDPAWSVVSPNDAQDIIGKTLPSPIPLQILTG